MSDEISNLKAYDPFADTGDDGDLVAGSSGVVRTSGQWSFFHTVLFEGLVFRLSTIVRQQDDKLYFILFLNVVSS